MQEIRLQRLLVFIINSQIFTFTPTVLVYFENEIGTESGSSPYQRLLSCLNWEWMDTETGEEWRQLCRKKGTANTKAYWKEPVYFVRSLVYCVQGRDEKGEPKKQPVFWETTKSCSYRASFKIFKLCHNLLLGNKMNLTVQNLWFSASWHLWRGTCLTGTQTSSYNHDDGPMVFNQWLKITETKHLAWYRVGAQEMLLPSSNIITINTFI